MRLLDAREKTFVEFSGQVPRYAILSHCWRENQEVTFHEVRRGFPSSISNDGFEKTGYAKIANCCAQALKDGLEYVWIDTCNIDKSSSAELSEAINAMFQW